MKHLLLTTIAAVCWWGVVSRRNKIFGVQRQLAILTQYELLIAVGQNVNAKNKDGETPLDIAVYKGLTKTTNILRKHGGKTGC